MHFVNKNNSYRYLSTLSRRGNPVGTQFVPSTQLTLMVATPLTHIFNLLSHRYALCSQDVWKVKSETNMETENNMSPDHLIALTWLPWQLRCSGFLAVPCYTLLSGPSMMPRLLPPRAPTTKTSFLCVPLSFVFTSRSDMHFCLEELEWIWRESLCQCWRRANSSS